MKVLTELEKVCEEFRTKLVVLFGDHAGIHNAVNDAQSALSNHVPPKISVPTPTEGGAANVDKIKPVDIPISTNTMIEEVPEQSLNPDG